MANEGATLGKTGKVLSTKRFSARSSTRRPFLKSTRSRTSNTVKLHPKSPDGVSTKPKGSNPTQNVRESPTSKGGSRAYSSDGTDYSMAAAPAQGKIVVKRRDSRLDLLEGCGQMDRGGRTDSGTICATSTKRSNNLLGEEYKIDASQPVPAIDVHSDPRGRNSGDRKLRPIHGGRPTHSEYNSSGDGPKDAEDSRSGIWNTFPEARRDNSPFQRGGARTRRSLRRSKHSKASMHKLPLAIQRQPYYDGESPRYSASFGSPPNTMTQKDVNLCFDQIPHVRRYSIICARRTSRLARTEDMDLPLHVKVGIPVMDVQKVKNWMSPEARRRLETVIGELFNTRLGAQPEPSTKGNLVNADITGLLEAGVIERVEEDDIRRYPTLQYVIPFTVVESDEEGNDRRRFISWTKDDNLRLKDYKSDVPLLHPSRYLHEAAEEAGVKRDLRCGFYQVPIPRQARAKFRFRDLNGVLHQMKVMPMGHRCAPEIMHKITATLAGDLAVCKPELVSCIGSVDVYIDGIRFAGSREQADKFVKFVDSRCKEVGGLFKEAGFDPSTEYVFNGVFYNHVTHKVNLGPRVIRKMSRDRFRNITYSQLETAVGRLLYAAAVLGHIIPDYHFPLKIVRRRINELNRCPELAHQPVPLPTATRSILANWRDIILVNEPISPPPHPDVVPHKHRLYTDASAKGWGAVLYRDDGQVIIVGDKWQPEFKYEVNHAEAMAVRLAFEKLTHHFQKGTCVDLFIDNTSCQAAFNRKIAKSDSIAGELKRVLKTNQNLGVCIMARYVRSAENPADPISRTG